MAFGLTLLVIHYQIHLQEHQLLCLILKLCLRESTLIQ